MRGPVVAVLVAVLLAGCGGGSSAQRGEGPASTAAAPRPDAAPRTDAVPRTDALIDIRPLTITFKGLPIARLFADGRTEAVGENPPGGAMSPGPTLHADGTIRLTKGGLTARLTREGELYVAHPGPEEALVARIAGEHVTFGDNGAHVEGDLLVFDDRQDVIGRIEGPVDAGMRRTALLMFAAFMIDMSLTR